MIKIRIDKEGNTHIEVNGVSGTSCEDLTAQLVSALGEAEETQYTEEYEQERPDYVESMTDEE